MFLFEKFNDVAEILILSDAVDFLTKSLGMPYSVVTAQQACSTEMVKTFSYEYNSIYIKQTCIKVYILKGLATNTTQTNIFAMAKLVY